MTEEIDFVAKYPKKDMSLVNRMIVNGKVYLAADCVLEIIDDIRFAIPVCQNTALAGYQTAITQMELRVLALKEGGEE